MPTYFQIISIQIFLWQITCQLLTLQSSLNCYAKQCTYLQIISIQILLWQTTCQLLTLQSLLNCYAKYCTIKPMSTWLTTCKLQAIVKQKSISNNSWVFILPMQNYNWYYKYYCVMSWFSMPNHMSITVPAIALSKGLFSIIHMSLCCLCTTTNDTINICVMSWYSMPELNKNVLKNKKRFQPIAKWSFFNRSKRAVKG